MPHWLKFPLAKVPPCSTFEDSVQLVSLSARSIGGILDLSSATFDKHEMKQHVITLKCQPKKGKNCGWIVKFIYSADGAVTTVQWEEEPEGVVHPCIVQGSKAIETRAPGLRRTVKPPKNAAATAARKVKAEIARLAKESEVVGNIGGIENIGGLESAEKNDSDDPPLDDNDTALGHLNSHALTRTDLAQISMSPTPFKAVQNWIGGIPGSYSDSAQNFLDGSESITAASFDEVEHSQSGGNELDMNLVNRTHVKAIDGLSNCYSPKVVGKDGTNLIDVHGDENRDDGLAMTMLSAAEDFGGLQEGNHGIDNDNDCGYQNPPAPPSILAKTESQSVTELDDDDVESDSRLNIAAAPADGSTQAMPEAQGVGNFYFVACGEALPGGGVNDGYDNSNEENQDHFGDTGRENASEPEPFVEQPAPQPIVADASPEDDDDEIKY